MIQGPWILPNTTRKVTKNYPGFTTFAPLSNWSSRPRLMTYPRKGRGLSPFQPNSLSRDLLQVRVSRRGKYTISCWNIYNATSGSKDPCEGLRLLLTQSQSPDILAGDLKIYHSTWDQAARGEIDDGEMLLTWTATKRLTLRNTEEIPTHDASAVLDLCFTRHSSHSQFLICHDLEIGSDRRTLLTHIIDKGSSTQVSDGIIHAACNWKKFDDVLRDLPISPPSLDPEEEAHLIVNTLTTSLESVCPRKKEKILRAWWWNSDCARTHPDFYQCRRAGLPSTEKRRIFGMKVKKERWDFWRSKVQKISNLKETY